MRRLSDRDRTAVALGVAAVLLLFLALVGATLLPRPSGCLYEYTVRLRLLPEGETPARSVNLSAGDLAAHPLIADVIDAYGRSEPRPPAWFAGDTLHFPVPASRAAELRVANDFLVDRWGVRSYPIPITTGDGRFYSWELQVSDPGYVAPCG